MSKENVIYEGSSSRVVHLGNAVAADGSGTCDVLQIMDRSGREGELPILHRETATAPKRFWDVVADANCEVPAKKEERAAVFVRLLDARNDPASTFLLVTTMGWHDKAFVVGNEVIAATPTEIRIGGAVAEGVAKFSTSGTAADYQKRVLKYAAHSSRALLAVAVALLAPLMRPLELELGGINWTGPAGIGKTTLLWLTGSIYCGWHWQDDIVVVDRVILWRWEVAIRHPDAFDRQRAGKSRLRAL